jgi:glycosyltransferase involved in cell wall biosynthesis
MRIALVAPPFISVPPVRYGGTELFIAHLADFLHRRGHHVVVYANGDSRVDCELRWLYPTAEWPLADPGAGWFKTLNHASWAVADCRRRVDVVHLNETSTVCLSPFIPGAKVLTLHHSRDPALSAACREHPEFQFVAISRAQAVSEQLERAAVIHHGLDPSRYEVRSEKDPYLAFLGRMAPYKGAHLAIEVARRTGIPLKLAGEVQPVFRDYWETHVRPHIDGRHIEYVGEADHAVKNELLSRAMALLFPIEWEEPFGLVMIEAMACGTPVVAFPRGSVPEIVEDGVNGRICRDVDEMVEAVRTLQIPADACRATVEYRFSVERMGEQYEALYQELLSSGAGSSASVAAGATPR